MQKSFRPIPHVFLGIHQIDSLDAKVDGFNDLFQACLNDFAPVKTIKIKRRSIPFMNEDIKEQIVIRNNLHKIACQTGSVEDWNGFKQQRCKVKLTLKAAEVEYYNEQILSNQKNCASLWKTIRNALPTKPHYSLEYTKETSALAEEFNRYFISVGRKASITSVNLAETCGLSSAFKVPGGNNISCDDAFEFRPATCLEVGKVIMDMPNNKAPGYDKVSFSVIKDCVPHILLIITSIINQSFASSVFPHAWKKAENNRPVSLLPVLSKVIEKLALQQYTNFLLEKNCLTNHQSGNKRYHSTETLGLLVADHLFNAIDKKKITAMVLIDLSKAFDSICHSTLLKKLQMLGTSPNALNWFKSYLTNREQSTRIECTVSTSLIVTHGVPQGSILKLSKTAWLSPLLMIQRSSYRFPLMKSKKLLVLYPLTFVRWQNGVVKGF